MTKPKRANERPVPRIQQFLYVHRVATALDCDERTVYSLVQEGRLEAIRLGSRGIRISRSSFEAFVAAQKIDPGEYQV